MLYLELFDPDRIYKIPIKSVHIPARFNYLKRLYIFNRDSIDKYYKSRNFAVKNTFILSRFVEHLPLMYGYDDYSYASFIYPRVVYLSKHFKFVSELEKGQVHPSYFFGNSGQDVIIADFNYPDVAQVVKNWQNAKSLKLLNISRNDTRLLLPLGLDDGSKSELNFISINLITLALQYREFLKEQYISAQNGSNVYNKNYFIVKYVLTNTVSDIIDNLFINRVIDLYYGNEIKTPKYKHKFKIFEPKDLNLYAEETLHNLLTKKLDFASMLANINLVFSGNALEFLALPDISMTRQNRVHLFLSRLKYIRFLCECATKTGYLSANKHDINNFKILIKRIEQDYDLENDYSFSFDNYSKIKEDMDYIKAL